VASSRPRRRVFAARSSGVVPVVALGLAGAFGVTRLRSFLFEVSPTDPVTLGAVAALLVAVTVLASWVPARRAASVDPMSALRSE
jgi:ABC-type lipoprotein release transport system permease subunit